jgi:hypothetical protein
MVPELAGTEPTPRYWPAGWLENPPAEHTAELQAEGGGQGLGVQQQMERHLQQKIISAAAFNHRQQSSESRHRTR